MTNVVFQVHINKRVKTNDKIQLPIDALLEQYQDQFMSSFVQSEYFLTYAIFIFIQYIFSSVNFHVLRRFYYYLHQNGVSKIIIRS